MPIENERKYVLDDPHGTLEEYLHARIDFASFEILQAYLSEDVRIRRFTPLDGGERQYVFSFKRKISGRQFEIETPMERTDFVSLLPTSRHVLVKHRFKMEDGDVHWDFDFLKDRRFCAHYFALAEAEMPAGMVAPERLPGMASAHLLFDVGGQTWFRSETPF